MDLIDENIDPCKGCLDYDGEQCTSDGACGNAENAAEKRIGETGDRRVKRRVIIDLVANVEEDEPKRLLFDDIEMELGCVWHDVEFTMREVKGEDDGNVRCDCHT